MRFRQYIPVKTASGGSNPDPHVYCPANGYFDPTLPLPYIPDEAIPEASPNPGEIILICSTAMDAAIGLTCQRATFNGAIGMTKYEVFGENDTLIYTENKGSNAQFFYQFPSTGGIPTSSWLQLFKVKISNADSTGIITSFNSSTKSGYSTNGWPIIEAHFNCPTLMYINDAFENHTYIRYIKFYDAHDNITNMNDFARNCPGLQHCIMNVSMNSLLSMTYAFFGSTNLEQIEFPPTLPSVTTIASLLGASGVKSFTLPSNLPECLSARGTFSGLSRYSNTLTIPAMPKVTDIVYMANNCKSIKKIVFISDTKLNTGTSLMSFQDNVAMEELHLEGNWGDGTQFIWGGMINNCPMLRILRLPDKYYTPKTGYGNAIGNDNNNVTSINTIDWTGIDSGITSAPFDGMKKLTEINQPTYSVTSFYYAGTSTSPHHATYINIDWAACTDSVTISYHYCPVKDNTKSPEV